MEWSTELAAFLADERLLANLIAVHVALLGLVVASLLVRQFLQLGGQRLLSWFGVAWLRGVTEEATGAARNLIYWITLAAMAACVLAAGAYHILGRDVRVDGPALWNRHVTADDIVRLGIVAGKVLAIAVGAWIACRLVHRLRLRLEARARPLLAEPGTVIRLDDPVAEDADVEISEDESIDDIPAPPVVTPVDRGTRRWFNLLERFAFVLIALGAGWLSARVADFPALESAAQFLGPLVSVAFVARLLTLSAHALSRGVARLGDQHLAAPSTSRYWDRAKRLFPFGEKCFEAVVYVWCASSMLAHLGWRFPRVELYSDRVIACIGIFFATRVVIELLHVLVDEAFGMFADGELDQKGQTLVPLLQSVIQYVLYFGSCVVMLEILEGPTNTILAGAGLLGLAVGLGAQSLVSDVVSGFFILFEVQYLVGDFVQIGDALGRVEVVSIRHTQIRDEQGKLHIIPNGQIKTVVNFSKDWVNAVVDIKVPRSASLDALVSDMIEAGRRLKTARKEVLGETQIRGLVDLAPGEMTVRAVTRVTPGSHSAMQCEYRRILKDVMDQRAARAAA